MGSSSCSVHRHHSINSIGYSRLADAEANADNIRSNSGTDGYCCSRCLCSQSHSCLVVLSAMVRAGIGLVHLLVPLSAAGQVEADAVAR